MNILDKIAAHKREEVADTKGRSACWRSLQLLPHFQ